MLDDAAQDAVSQLPLNIDGLPLVGARESQYALRAAIETLPAELEAVLADLRGERVAVVSDFFDPVVVLLNALDVRWVRVAGEDLALSALGIAIAGCPHRHARLDARDVDVFLERGGVLVSSDRAARMAGLARYLPVDGGSPPARARVVLTPELRDERLPDHVLPAVWLDPGHQPLGEPLQGTAEVLAYDAMTGLPLAVMQPVLGGTMLHAVPHWMQDSPTVAPTGFEAQSLSSVPAFASIGNSYPQLSLGAYLSVSVMLRLLLEGLRRAPSAQWTRSCMGERRGNT